MIFFINIVKQFWTYVTNVCLCSWVHACACVKHFQICFIIMYLEIGVSLYQLCKLDLTAEAVILKHLYLFAGFRYCILTQCLHV